MIVLRRQIMRQIKTVPNNQNIHFYKTPKTKKRINRYAFYEANLSKVQPQIKDLLCTFRCLEVLGIFTARTLVRGFRRSSFPVAIDQLKVIHGTHRLH